MSHNVVCVPPCADVQTRLHDIEAEMESIDTKLASMASLLDEVTRVSVSSATHMCDGAR